LCLLNKLGGGIFSPGCWFSVIPCVLYFTLGCHHLAKFSTPLPKPYVASIRSPSDPCGVESSLSIGNLAKYIERAKKESDRVNLS